METQRLNEGLYQSLGFRVQRIMKAHRVMKMKDREIRGLICEIRRLCLVNNEDFTSYLNRHSIFLKQNFEGRYDITIEK